MSIQDRIFLAFVPLVLLLVVAGAIASHVLHESRADRALAESGRGYLEGMAGQGERGVFIVTNGRVLGVRGGPAALADLVPEFAAKLADRVYLDALLAKGGLVRTPTAFVYLQREGGVYRGVYGWHNRRAERLQFTSIVLTTSLWSFFVVLIAALFLSRRITMPLQSMIDHFHAQAKIGGYSLLDAPRLAVGGRELEALALAYNELIARLERLNRQALRMERLAAVGRTVAEIAHDVRNPLNAMAGAVRVLEDEGHGGKYVQLIKQKIAALNRYLEQMLLFARDDRVERQPCDLEPVVRALAQTYNSPVLKCRLEGWPGTPPVLFDPDALRRILGNLFDNAVQAMPQGGEIAVVAAVEQPGFVTVRIRDTGPGLSETVREHLFEPFYRERAAGTGLGLAIVKRLLEENGGKIEGQNHQEGGAEFILRFPLA